MSVTTKVKFSQLDLLWIFFNQTLQQRTACCAAFKFNVNFLFPNNFTAFGKEEQFHLKQ